MFVSRSQLRVLCGFVCLATALFGADSSLEIGNYQVQQFTAKNYGASPQNWAVLQDSRGILYVGNTAGLLEYDGVLWRRITLPRDASVRALGIDGQGRVLVGSQGDFGYLSANQAGSLQFQSLLDRLPAEHRKFGDVWSILALPEGTYFSTYQRLILWRKDGTFHVWKPKTTFGRAYLVGDKVIVVEQGEGLLQVEGDALIRVPGSSELPVPDIRSVFLWNRELTITTREGIYQLSRSRSRQFRTDADAAFVEFKIYSAVPIAGGRLAVGTTRGGLFLLDRDGRLEARIGKEEGLPGDYVTSIFPDRQDHLWLTTSAGIARVNPFASIFDERRGLRGGVITITRFGGDLYAGTQTGLYRLDRPSMGFSIFTPVPGIAETVVVLQAAGGDLLAGAQRGLYRLKGGKAELIQAAEVIYDLHVSASNPNIVFGVGRSGLMVFEKSSAGWKQIQHLSAGGEEYRSVVEDSDGKVWIATRSEVIRVDWRLGPSSLERFGPKQNVPAGWKNVYRVDGRITLATPVGPLSWDARSQTFVPDRNFQPITVSGPRDVSLIRPGTGRDLWISGSGYHGILRKEQGGYGFRQMPMLDLGLTELYALHVDSNGVTWAAGPDGWLARFEPAGLEIPASTASVSIRSVQSQTQESALYAGAPGISPTPVIQYGDRALRFEVSAPMMEQEELVEYQYWLEGADESWSRWTQETRKDYTNVHEGKYVFHVRARHPRLGAAAEATFGFRVLPPWYRTWWAYAIYVLSFGLSVWGLIRWRLQALRESNRKLEQTIEERTAEIRRQRDQIREEERRSGALLRNILPDSVAEELRSTGLVRPMSFDHVTICFTDFVGFTLAGEKLDAYTIVEALHEYFTAFDEVADRYGVEKMKTIGDAYMFAAGLPGRSASHAVDAVMAALEIIEKTREIAFERKDTEWRIRVGLHSGPVVAGVVGVRKFAFDVWGSTVNFASRMESAGSPGRVNLSAGTAELVRDFIELEPRGRVRTKEGREVEMYFANGLRPELAGDGSEPIPRAFRDLYVQRFGLEPKACLVQRKKVTGVS
jgi:class 3 adenylate cyclase